MSQSRSCAVENMLTERLYTDARSRLAGSRDVIRRLGPTFAILRQLWAKKSWGGLGELVSNLVSKAG